MKAKRSDVVIVTKNKDLSEREREKKEEYIDHNARNGKKKLCAKQKEKKSEKKKNKKKKINGEKL